VATVDTPVRDEGAAHAPKARPAVVVAGARTHFRRFTPFQRWVHFFIMISFSTLVLTGMPLKYSDKAWAESWMGLIGGLENAGMIHRFAAIIMVLCGICMIGLFLKVLVQFKGRYWGPGTMVPTWQDYRDLKAMVSWFIGRSPRPHLQLDRYAYYEKGEFWAATGGCSIMIVTGAILWYPEVASRFLPGIVINFALVNHSGGALLAGLVLGYLRAIRPTFGRIPTPALVLMNTLGLNVFIAIVGINAGPGFIAGLQDAGLRLFLWGIVATSVPLILAVLLGYHVFKFHPAILFGVCAGVRTTTAALGMIQDAGKSKVPALGYGMPYAIGNTLLTIFGMAVVLWMSGME